MPDSLERRLDRIEQQQVELLVGQATMNEHLTSLNGSVDDLLAEVGHVPDVDARGERRTVTTRLHDLEGTFTPATLDASLHRVLRQRRVTVWGYWQKLVTISGVVVGTVFTVLRFAGLGG